MLKLKWSMLSVFWLVVAFAACAPDSSSVLDEPTTIIKFSGIDQENPTFRKDGAFTAESEHGDSLWGLSSDPTTDFGFDKLSINRPGTSPPSAIGGYPMGLITRKIRASHDKNWPVDLFLSEFSIIDTGDDRELTYATEWGITSSGRRNGWVGWLNDDKGYPTHIMTSHANDDSRTLDSWVFSKDGSISYLWQVKGITTVELNYEWLGALPDLFDIKVISVNNSNEIIMVSSDQLWLAMVFSSTGTIPDVEVDRTTLTAKISFEMGLPIVEHLFGAGIGISGDSEKDAIARALQSSSIDMIQQRLIDATGEWSIIQSGVVIPEEMSINDEKYVRLLVNNVASLSFAQPNNTYYIIASNGGVNQHYWLRDAAITVIGLSRFHPIMAAQILEWLNAHPVAQTVDQWEWFNFDGTGGTNGSPGIDASAWLALAIGRTYDNLPESKKIEFALATSIIRDRLVERVREQWDADKGHLDIQPHRDHDWWDNLGGRTTNTGLAPLDFKFEMGPEVVWSAGLQLFAPIYADLGDSSTANYVLNVADTLEANLDDFQLSDGRGLGPAIDANDVLVDSPGMVFVWGNVAAAAFLGRRSSFDALVAGQNVLRRVGINYFTLQQAYYDDLLGARQSDSNLFEWLASGVDARWGNGELSDNLRGLFDIPWSPRDTTSNGSELFIPNGLNYTMTTGFQLESLRFEYEGANKKGSARTQRSLDD